jgi:hypothetical protein
MKNKTHVQNSFAHLANIKHTIALEFSKEFFEDDLDFYWLGEVLSIADCYVELDDIQTALLLDCPPFKLFEYLSKDRNYGLEQFLLGKKERKKQRKKDLKNSAKKVKKAKQYLEECLCNNKQHTPVIIDGKFT